MKKQNRDARKIAAMKRFFNVMYPPKFVRIGDGYAKVTYRFPDAAMQLSHPTIKEIAAAKRRREIKWPPLKPLRREWKWNKKPQMKKKKQKAGAMQFLSDFAQVYRVAAVRKVEP